jgi:hypothetical protein
MKNMNVSVEVKSGLKQLKNSVEVENNKKQNADTTTDSLKSRSVYNGCGSDITFKSRFVYGMCGYHLTPIPHKLQPKLEIAHPSPLFGLLSVYKRLLSNYNPWLRFDKLTRLFSRLLIHCLAGLSIGALCLRNNMNISQSKSTSTNDISTNGPYNEDNLQYINIENELYENRLTDYTYNNMVLSNITKI